MERILFHKIYKGPPDSSEAPLVILHGLFGTLDNWHNIARKLSEQRTVIGVDQRNHGRSFHDPVMDLPTMAQDLEQILSHLGIEECDIIGHSMGGKVAMHFALNHPGFVRKLVVVDIAPKQYKPGHDRIFEAMFSLDLPNIESRKEAESKLSEYIEEQGIRLFILKNIDRDENGGFRWKIDLDSISATYENILIEIESPWPYSDEVLFIRGEQSGYITKDDEAHIPEFFANAECVTIKDAGHWVHADAPEEFVRIAEEFLND